MLFFRGKCIFLTNIFPQCGLSVLIRVIVIVVMASQMICHSACFERINNLISFGHNYGQVCQSLGSDELFMKL